LISKESFLGDGAVKIQYTGNAQTKYIGKQRFVSIVHTGGYVNNELVMPSAAGLEPGYTVFLIVVPGFSGSPISIWNKDKSSAFQNIVGGGVYPVSLIGTFGSTEVWISAGFWTVMGL